MTTEEKAKAYDEALERAKGDYIAYKKVGDIAGMDAITSIFPELAESEDERIRKWLIDYVRRFVFKTETAVDKRAVLAWLEKQKKEKPVENNYPEYNPDDYESFEDGNATGWRRKEQKEHKLSVDDAMKSLDEHIEKAKKSWEGVDADKFMEEVRGEQKPDIEICPHTKSKSFIEVYMKGYNDAKKEVNKPAEWSEKDEGMLNCIIATLCEESHGGRETNERMVSWLENRLKSLRP